MARPSTAPIHWATDAGTRATLTTVRQDQGWLPSEVLPALSANTIWGEALDWSAYLAEISPADSVVRVKQYDVLDQATGATVVGRIVETSGTDVTANTPTGHRWIFQDGGTDILALDTAAGVRAFEGFAAQDNASSGARYGYVSRLAITRDLSAGVGGWLWTGNVSGHGLTFNGSGAGDLALIYPAGATRVFERGLEDVLPGDNAELRTAGTVAVNLVTLRGTLTAVSGDDILVELIEVDRSTWAETTILQLPSSGTPQTSTTPTAHTDTPFGAVSVDQNANVYLLRVTLAGGTGGVAAVRDLRLDIGKIAVE